MALIETGFAENLMFSADLSGIAQTRHGGGPVYARTLTLFVPKVTAAGASDEVLQYRHGRQSPPLPKLLSIALLRRAMSRRLHLVVSKP
jgi:hypothetical protein